MLKSASLILPVHSDPDFATKREVIARVAAETGWRLLIPDYDGAAPIFDAARARTTLAEAALVIADLSRARPSCYFELGFAEALGKPVRLIAEAGTEIHQTGARDVVAFYEGPHKFRDALAAILASS
jgi:hypothetical protein